MDAELISKYEARQVPRYTSYPTAPHFSAAVGAADYARWLAELPAEARLSLYLHVPFCRSMCWYCGCHTRITGRDEPVAGYAGALAREVQLVAGHLPGPLAVDHVHWGGGTPTIVGAGAFAALMALLRRQFRLSDDAEIAVEIDPRRAEPELLRALAAAGVTRASLGVQSFDPAVQQAINRVQSFAQTRDAVAALRAAGVRGINFDLLYGLPKQTVESCVATVAQAIELRPDRFAVFGYAHVPWMKKHQRLIDETVLPGGRERFAQAQAIGERLEAAGYVRIGLDHFAHPEDPLARALRDGTLRRNFQGYTTDRADALLGFGASAIGALPQGYVQNIVQTGAYERAVAAGELPVARGLALGPDDRLRRDVIEQIMCYGCVDLGALSARHWTCPAALDDALPALEALQADGIVEWDGAVLRVRDEAAPLLRTVAAAFDSYLSRAPGRHSRAV